MTESNFRHPIRQIFKTLPPTNNARRTIRELKRTLFWGPLWPISRHRLMHHSGMSLAKLVTNVLRSGDIAFDIGANIGMTAQMMSLCAGKSGLVYAFEPNPTCFSELEQLAKSVWFHNLKAFPFALSDRASSVVMHVDTRPGSVASTIIREHAQRESMWHDAGYSQTAVTAITLDTFCETHEVVPTFLKVDVEGAEEKVIQGSNQIIDTKQPMIWFECWGGVENGTPINQNLGHFEFLSGMNYIFFLATVFKLNGEWHTESSTINPKQLLSFDPEILVNMPAIGCDILAVPPKYLSRLKNTNLLSSESAKIHLQKVVHEHLKG